MFKCSELSACALGFGGVDFIVIQHQAASSDMLYMVATRKTEMIQTDQLLFSAEQGHQLAVEWSSMLKAGSRADIYSCNGALPYHMAFQEPCGENSYWPSERQDLDELHGAGRSVGCEGEQPRCRQSASPEAYFVSMFVGQSPRGSRACFCTLRRSRSQNLESNSDMPFITTSWHEQYTHNSQIQMRVQASQRQIPNFSPVI
jgi:hypothetical protein